MRVSVGTIEERKAHTGPHGVHGPYVGMRESRHHEGLTGRDVGENNVKTRDVLEQNVLGSQKADDALQLGDERRAVVESPRRLKGKQVSHVHIAEFLKLRLQNHRMNLRRTEAYREHHR